MNEELKDIMNASTITIPSPKMSIDNQVIFHVTTKKYYIQKSIYWKIFSKWNQSCVRKTQKINKYFFFRLYKAIKEKLHKSQKEKRRNLKKGICCELNFSIVKELFKYGNGKSKI